MWIPLIALAALSLSLAACAQPEGVSAVGDDAGGGDQPVASDPITPVGGDLRIGEPWFLVGASVSSVPMPEGVVLTFEADRVGGRAPVNSWSAQYSASAAGALEFGPIASTRMAGPEEAMRAEDAYLALLEGVDGYTTVESGELYLFDDQMDVLTFSAVPQPAGEPTISDSTLELAADVIGTSEAEAQASVENAGLVWRVAARDGEQFALTEDYVVVRINATIVGGVVTETWVG